MRKTKEQIELMIGDSISKILKEQLGEIEKNTTTKISNETILIRLKNAISPAEKYLMQDPEGARTIKELKGKIIENIKPKIKNIIKKLTGTKVSNIYSDIDTKTGERIVIITTTQNLEEKFKK